MMCDGLKLLSVTDDYVVCIKPAGLLSEMSAEPCVPAVLADQIGGDIYTVHRLDRSVGGVMMYARTRAAAANLSQQVADRTMRKRYLAVVHGRPELDSGEMCDYLFKDSRTNKSFVVKRPRKGTKEARLMYEVLATAERDGQTYSLVQICLITGRSHQIRVQFSHRRMPLVGDGRYGGREKCDIALWSHEVECNFGGETVKFSAEPDYGNYPWNMFK